MSQMEREQRGLLSVSRGSGVRAPASPPAQPVHQPLARRSVRKPRLQRVQEEKVMKPWREIERQLVEFFGSEGGEIESADGEAYLTIVLLEAVKITDDVWQEERQVSLSALARHIASGDEGAYDIWRPLGVMAAHALKKRRA